MDNLDTIARSLAAELSAADFPHLWRVVPGRREWWREIKTDDAWLTLQIANHRLVIATDRPRQMKTAGQSERITASLDRSPQAIAQDITRRLLPNAREYFQNCRAWTRKCKQEREEHAQILHILEPFTEWKRTDSDGRQTDYRAHRARANIVTDRIYSMTVDDLTTDEAIRILTILKER